MRRRAQGILDYILLLAIAVAALVIMGYYIRNTLCGKIRDGADVIGKGAPYNPAQSP